MQWLTYFKDLQYILSFHLIRTTYILDLKHTQKRLVGAVNINDYLRGSDLLTSEQTKLKKKILRYSSGYLAS